MQTCDHKGFESGDKFCPDCGKRISSPAPEEDRDRYRISKNSAETHGDNSPNIFGPAKIKYRPVSKVRPRTTRDKTRTLASRGGMVAVSATGVVAGVAQITGLSVFGTPGLADYWSDASKAADGYFLLLLALLLTSGALALGPLALVLTIKIRGYLHFGIRWILEFRGGRLTVSKVLGVCPDCSGRLRLANIIVGKKPVTKEANGSKYTDYKDVYERRLVCDRNRTGHVFAYDITRTSGA